MIDCPVCKNREYEGTLYCSKCGARLWSGETGKTTRLKSEVLGDVGSNAQEVTRKRPPTVRTIKVYVDDTTEPITLMGKDEYRLGRVDPQQQDNPDLDLTPYNGLTLGVSRIHLCVQQTEDGIAITDLGSSNGTYLKGKRLRPNRASVIKSGDDIRLGKLDLKIFFE